MANEYFVNSDDLIAVASAIREKGGTEDSLVFPDEFVTAIQEIRSGGGGAVEEFVRFYDYDGTLLYTYTLSEAKKLTSFPDGPAHPGLIFDGWNYTIEKMKNLTTGRNIGALYSTDDGATRIYIHLEEGRTSPMLGICPNGTVTVNWGDGTNSDVLTGTSLTTVAWTPTHNYASPGDYVIRLIVDGEAQLYGYISYNQRFPNILTKKIPISSVENIVYRKAIRKVEIGSRVSIGDYAFSACTFLSSITIPNGVTSIGQSAFYNCSSLSSITIPDGETSIRDYTFYDCCSLSSITIPDSLISIGLRAFSNCTSLSSITIPDRVTSIGQYAFDSCYSLPSITIPNGVTSISQYTFDSCRSLSSVIIPNGVTSIGDYAFSSCDALSSITIPDGVTSIGLRAFNYCVSLLSITIPDGVTKIGDYAFSNCTSLSSITIPNGVTSIGQSAFYNCTSLSSITIPNGVTSISKSAFDSCVSLLSITIPDGLTKIGQSAFYDCYSLSSITIPDGVTSIEKYTFYECYGMKYYDFTSHQAVPTLSNKNVFNSISSDCEIRVPAALANEWKAATNWATYANYIVGV